MKKQLTILLFVTISIVSFAQKNNNTTTNTVTFTADITEFLAVGLDNAFDPTQDSLLIVGFDSAGCEILSGTRKLENWEPFYPALFSTTLTLNSNIDSIYWKFKAFPSNRFKNDGFEFYNDRVYVFSITDTLINLPIIFPRIKTKLLPIPPVDLTINVDMTGAINRYNGLEIPTEEIEYIGIRGSADFIGSLWDGCWCSDDTLTGDMKVLVYDTLNNWKFHTNIPSGNNGGYFIYNFATMYKGADTINSGIFPLANEFPMHYNSHSLFINGTDTTVILHKKFGVHSPDEVEIIKNLLPAKYGLEQNYPNPFNPTTVIRYSVPEIGHVTLKVFDLLGQEIELLVNSEQPAGVYEATFDATNLPSGIYFYQIKAGDFTQSKKMILLK